MAAAKAGDPLPAFTVDEYKMRVARIQELLDAGRLDALFVSTEAHFRYLSGFASPAWFNPARPRYCVVPRLGDPFIVSPTSNIVVIETLCWIKDNRTWVSPRPADDGISLLVDGLKSCLGKYGRIGAELGPESRMGFPVADFLRLRDLLAPAEVVDGDAILRKVRMIKSPAEVSRMRRIAEIASAAFKDLPRHVKPGDTERSACNWLNTEMIRLGAHATAYIGAQGGPAGYTCLILPPSERQLLPGDLFTIDTGASLEGYYCDFSRQWAIEKIPEKVHRAYEIAWHMAEAGIAAVKPGRRVKDVWQAEADRMTREAWPDGTRLQLSKVGRMGHGIGLQLTEPPSVHPDDATELKPGMTITIEPALMYGVEGPNGPEQKQMVTEEIVVVTDTGCELLTERAPRALPVIGDAP